ncbi:MAG: DoxX family protein [Pseudonocardiaceae bacterium]
MIEADVASLLVRLVLGATMILHGYNHGLGPGGIDGTARWFGKIGLRPPRLHAWASCVLEIAAGVGLLVGLLTPLAAAATVGVMAVAGVVAHRKNGFFVFRDGYEYVLVVAVVCVALGALGPGIVSLDHALGIAIDGWAGGLVVAGGGLLGAGLLLALSWRPQRSG